jgi:hypothetical protein
MKRGTLQNMRSCKEVEGFGVTYDRYIMRCQQRILIRQLGLKTILESPSHGAKAAGSLYSVGYALGGCDVTLVNPEPAPLAYWNKLGLRDRLTTILADNPARLPFGNGQFDLAWNFVTFTGLADQDAWLEEMRRVSNRHVMVISCNNLQLGYPWHRVIHLAYGFPWNHGNVHFNYVWNVRKWFNNHGLTILESGAIDTPPWPDPVGFRDIRLHKRFAPDEQSRPDWEVPMMEYLHSKRVPRWIRALALYDIPLRRGYLKLPFSHLFYVIGSKD